jgi:transposase InsO family protein
VDGIKPLPRTPHSSPNQVSAEIKEAILALRAENPYWGGVTLHSLLRDKFGEETPHVRTVERLLGKYGLLVQPRKPRGRWLDRDALIRATTPNKIWTVDFKGWWRTRDGKPCFPLTVRDAFSRKLLGVIALKGTSFEGTKEAFIELFEKYGLPDEILSDNGTPFASVLAVQGLTQLSAWWVKLGIRPRRILPGCPFMNGSHERMHRDIKRELQCEPARNIKEEQKRFDEWTYRYNAVRPNQALQGRRPDQVYVVSPRRMPEHVVEFEYPKEMNCRRVDSRGHISWHQKRCFVAGALSGETLGIEKRCDGFLSLWFCELNLGVTDRWFDSPLGGNQTSPYGFRHVRNRKV